MAKNTSTNDDEIDLFEVIQFFIGLRRYVLIGGFGLGGLALVYALVSYPTTARQLVINDVGLDLPKLTLMRSMLPAMVTPLELEMRALGLEGLYSKITQNASFLDEAVVGRSGVNLKDKGLTNELKNQVNVVEFTLSGAEVDTLTPQLNFLVDGVHAFSQYLDIKRWLDESSRTARINLFNTEAQVNAQRLNQERAQNQLVAYAKLQPAAKSTEDIQVILNLSNESVTLGDQSKMNRVQEFSGAKYLPLANRMLAIQSELADLTEAIAISERQIEAVKLQQSVLNQLEVTFNTLPFNAQVIDMEPFIAQVTDARPSAATREDVAILNTLEGQLLGYDVQGSRFTNRLPAVIEKKGRGKLVIIAGLLGGVLGLLIGSVVHISQLYRRRQQSD